tara:strand:+ start:93 stop:641 length:549 start_codon:yes stop_codon:yes gene_type:complete
MKKLTLVLFLFLFMQNNLFADLRGFGEIKLNQYNINQFEKYLSETVHNKHGGHQRSGTGLVFAITEDGQDSGYYYCFKGNSCNADRALTDTIRHCERKAKKSSGVKKKCRIFAKKRKIVWNDLNKTIPKGFDVKQFLNELGLVSHEKPPENIEEEQIKQLKSLLKQGIINQKEFEEAIKAIQ